MIAEGRFTSGSDGSAVEYLFDTQDWGLRVRDVNYAVVVTGRSGTNAKFKLTHRHGAIELIAAMLTASDPISFTQLNSQLPKTYLGSVQGETLPFFLTGLSVAAQSGATEEYVEVKIYAGGKQY